MLGGLLVQDPDTDIEDREGWQVVTGMPSEQQLGDLVFAWRVCKHVLSNAIVHREGPADDRDRRRADEPGRRGDDRGREGARARARPDAAPSSPRMRSSRSPTARSIALDAGVSSIVQPGGSRRDEDVIDAVADADAAMVFTGRRHFRH